MNKLLMILSLVVPCGVLAQGAGEASGQTVVFDLTPGATAAWNDVSSTAVESPFPEPTARAAMRVAIAGRTIRASTAVPVPASASLSIHSIQGQLALRERLSSDAVVVLPRSLAAGCYVVRVENGPSVLYNSHFLLAR